MSFATARLIGTLGVIFSVGCTEPRQAEGPQQSAGTGSRARQKKGQPVLEFAERERDLGEMPVDQTKASTTFRFRNVGDAPLRITEIETTCGCAVASVHPPTLEPGGEGEIMLSLRRSEPKPWSATITVLTNDPMARVVRLRVKWRPVAPVEFEPYSLDFGTLVPGATAEQAVSVVRRIGDGEPGDFRRAELCCEPSNDLQAFWAEPSDLDGSRDNGARLRVVLGAGDEPGEYHGSVVLKSNEHDRSDLVLPVRWDLRELIEASPRALFLGSAGVGSERAGIVVISSPSNESALEVAAIRVTPDDGVLSVTSEQRSSNQMHVRVNAQFTWSGGPKSWELAVICERPFERTLRVKVSAHSRGSE